MISIAIAAADLIGVLGFAVAAVLAARSYRDQNLLGNYWLISATGTLVLALWALSEFFQWIDVATWIFDEPLQILLLTTGLAAFLLAALYDNTENEALLRELERSEYWNALVVDQFPDGGVVLFDDSLRVRLAGGTDVFESAGRGTLAPGDHVAAPLPADAAAALVPRARAALRGEDDVADLAVAGETYEARTLPVDDRRTGGPAGLLVARNVTEQRAREAAIEAQRSKLETLDRINRVVREVDHALVGAQSREEIEQAVCEILSQSGAYRFALVAEGTPDGSLRARTWAGEGADYVADIFDGDVDLAEGPGAEAMATGEIQVIQSVDESPDFDLWRESALELDFRSLAAVPIRYDGTTYGVLAVYSSRRHAFDERERSVLDQFGRTIGHAIASVERKERADVLTALHRATRDLLRADSADDIAEIVVSAARGLLDVEVAVFLYDEDRHELSPAATTDGALDYYEDDPTYSPGDTDSITWQTFASGEQRVFDDVRGAEHLRNIETDARGAIFCPLGEHGVLEAGTSEFGAFTDHRRRLVELLASTTEAALDRLASEADLRDRESQLREHNERLRDLQRVNDVIRAVDRALVSAATREEVERFVCDRLVGEDRFRFAWIADPGDDGAAPTPRSWAGEGGEYLDEDVFDADADPPEPTVRTGQSGDPTVVSSVDDYRQRAEWVSHALDCGFQSVLSVPIARHDVLVATLTVYSAEPDAFDEETTDVLTQLGETIAHAIDAIETKRGLLAPGGTELELRIADPDRFLNEVAALSDEPVICLETTPKSGSATRVVFRVDDVSPEMVLALGDRFVSVESVEHVADSGDEHVFAATVTGDTVAGTMAEIGAIPGEVEVAPDSTRVIVSLLPHVDVRDFVGAVERRYGDVELVAKRDREVRHRSRDAFVDEFERAVTDRQLEVLRTAYERGYFESPRAASGQDVAEALGVSQPTINHHLRESQRRLIALLFGDAADDRATERH